MDSPHSIFRFAEFELDPDKRLLSRQGEPVALNSKAFDLLIYFIENSGRILTKDELLNSVWDDRFVEESNLVVQISNLRKSLGEQTRTPRFIVTIPGQGYKFIEKVVNVSTANEPREQLPRENSGTDKAPYPGYLLLLIAIFLLLGVVGLVFLFSGSQTLKTESNDFAAGSLKKSIAVLPFGSVGRGENDEALTLGLTENLINRLSGIERVSVRPITAVKKYSGDGLDFASIGRDLSVDLILEGNIQRDSERIRVTIRLLDLKNGNILWNDQIDEDFADIFAVQDRISKKVTGSLQIALSSKERTRLEKSSTRNHEAYKKYLEGRYHWNKRTSEGFYRSIELINEAINMDPLFSLAYAGLADNYLLMGLYGIESTKDAFPKARFAAEKALEIDPDLGEAYVSLAMVENLFEYNWKAAESHFKKAIELQPSYSTGHHWFGLFLAMQGRASESELELSKAAALDPLSSSVNTDLAFSYFLSNQREKAFAQLAKVIKTDPNFANAYVHLGLNYLAERQFDAAKVEFSKAANLSLGRSGKVETVWALGFSGKAVEARTLLSALPAELGTSKFETAVTFASFGEKEKAVQALNEAYDLRDPQLVAIKVYPLFEDLKGHLGFESLLTKMRLQNQ